MKQSIIKAEIYFDGEYYCARCLSIDVFTQGNTLNEPVKKLRDAVYQSNLTNYPHHVEIY